MKINIWRGYWSGCGGAWYISGVAHPISLVFLLLIFSLCGYITMKRLKDESTFYTSDFMVSMVLYRRGGSWFYLKVTGM